jgi:hypothetical protein
LIAQIDKFNGVIIPIDVDLGVKPYYWLVHVLFSIGIRPRRAPGVDMQASRDPLHGEGGFLPQSRGQGQFAGDL